MKITLFYNYLKYNCSVKTPLNLLKQSYQGLQAIKNLHFSLKTLKIVAHQLVLVKTPLRPSRDFDYQGL